MRLVLFLVLFIGEILHQKSRLNRFSKPEQQNISNARCNIQLGKVFIPKILVWHKMPRTIIKMSEDLHNFHYNNIFHTRYFYYSILVSFLQEFFSSPFYIINQHHPKIYSSQKYIYKTCNDLTRRGNLPSNISSVAINLSFTLVEVIFCT